MRKTSLLVPLYSTERTPAYRGAAARRAALLAGLLRRSAALADVAAGDVGLDVVAALVHVHRVRALLQLGEADRHLGGGLAVDHVLEAPLRLRIELRARAFMDVRGLRGALRPALEADLDARLVLVDGGELRRAGLLGLVLRRH